MQAPNHPWALTFVPPPRPLPPGSRLRIHLNADASFATASGFFTVMPLPISQFEKAFQEFQATYARYVGQVPELLLVDIKSIDGEKRLAALLNAQPWQNDAAPNTWLHILIHATAMECRTQEEFSHAMYRLAVLAKTRHGRTLPGQALRRNAVASSIPPSQPPPPPPTGLPQQQYQYQHPQHQWPSQPQHPPPLHQYQQHPGPAGGTYPIDATAPGYGASVGAPVPDSSSPVPDTNDFWPWSVHNNSAGGNGQRPPKQ